MSQPAPYQSPLRLVLILLFSIFLCEAGIMAVFVALPPFAPWVVVFMDSVILAVLVTPILILLVFRPLTLEVEQRKQIEMSLRDAQDHLESNIRERTAELEQRNREIGLMAEISHSLQACTKVEEAYGVITETGRRLFPGMTGIVFVYNAFRTDLEAVAGWGDPALDLKENFFMSEECWALRRGQVHVYLGGSDSNHSLHCRHVPSDLTATYMCVPMLAQGEVLGILHLRQMVPEGNTVPLIEKLVLTLTEYVALALMNLKIREALRNESIRDPLTGLFNRRYMEETLNREIRRAERGQGKLGVVMLDIDHFKRFNDTYGHDAGDLVLREVGQYLKAQMRGGDVACRYGGEELALIMPDMPLETLGERVEALRLGIKQLGVWHHNQLLGAITVSAGIAMYPDNGTTRETVLHAADQALYQAKADGRDRLVLSATTDARS